MGTNQEKRYSRVAEGIYRSKSGGFHLRHMVEGKTTSHKLKSVDLLAARMSSREVMGAVCRDGVD